MTPTGLVWTEKQCFVNEDLWTAETKTGNRIDTMTATGNFKYVKGTNPLKMFYPIQPMEETSIEKLTLKCPIKLISTLKTVCFLIARLIGVTHKLSLIHI